MSLSTRSSFIAIFLPFIAQYRQFLANFLPFRPEIGEILLLTVLSSVERLTEINEAYNDGRPVLKTPWAWTALNSSSTPPPSAGLLEPVFEMLGFTQVARHRSKDVNLWRQGDINFIINYEKNSPAYYYCEEHGPSACGMAFRVKDAKQAYQRALDLGAQPIDIPVGPMELKLPAIRGIGGAILYLIDRYEEGASIYDIDFEYLEGVDRHPAGCGFELIDHLTHNVYRGRMDYWANYYEKAVQLPRNPLLRHQGRIHRAALTGDDRPRRQDPDSRSMKKAARLAAARSRNTCCSTMARESSTSPSPVTTCPPASIGSRQLGMRFMTPPPDTYYEMLEERLPGHGEPVDELKSRGILLDGSTENGEPRLLLQIFSETLIGPIFFEFIQRKHDEGFGEGNFQALFESIERDQLARGAIDATILPPEGEACHAAQAHTPRGLPLS